MLSRQNSCAAGVLATILLIVIGPGATRADDAASPASRSDVAILLDEIDRLNNEIAALHQALAEAQLQASAARQRADELQQFVDDHHEFGDDFQQYQEVKAIAEREARLRAAEENRQRRDAERLAQQARREALRQAQAQRDAERDRVRQYQNFKFSPLGLDVYNGRMAYHYRSRTNTESRFDYEPGFGRYQRFYPPTEEIDYTRMTISGSILNAADEVRNIGVAITFFDESGNQVGHEIVQLRNARPNVPYPFTSTIDMALNRPFNSSSLYVLYADPVDVAEEEPPTPPSE
jgi:multidrug efflux pump subunit AcrA (membrane-fusion protein)